MLSRPTSRLARQSIRLASRAAVARSSALHLNLGLSSHLPSGITPCFRRNMTTPAPQLSTSSELTDEQYHEYSDATMETLLDSLEDLLDQFPDPDYEVEYSSGVLTLKLGDIGTYVINKQPPNRQIWLSSPISGPKRYDFVPRANKWIYSRDHHSLGELMNAELSKTLKQEVDLGVDDLPRS